MKGLPDRVENINITSLPGALALAWEWPALSANTTFCVAVYSVSSSECVVNPRTLNLEQCRLENTSYVFTSGAEGEQYGFVVTAMSSLGQGPPSHCVVAGFSSGKDNQVQLTIV